MKIAIVRFTPVPLVFVLLAIAGCGAGLAPVRGKVTVEGQGPLTKGMVVFESADGTHMARGTIQADGSYELSTGRPGDGVKPGRYRALVSAQEMTDVPDERKQLPFDVKYTRLQTSGLEFEVKPGPNDIPITLTRSRRSRGN